MNRTFPLTIGITTGNAAASLAGRIRTIERTVYLVVVFYANFDRFFFRIAARYFQELQRMNRHTVFLSCLAQRLNQHTQIGGLWLHYPESRQESADVLANFFGPGTAR